METHMNHCSIIRRKMIDTSESQVVRHHLEECPDCRQYADEMAELTTMFQRQANESLPSPLSPRVLRQVAQTVRTGGRPVSQRHLFWTYGGAAGAIVTLLTMAIWVSHVGAPQLKVEVGQLPTHPLAERTASGPSWGAFRLALNMSEDSFDRMLTVVSKPPSPVSSGDVVLRPFDRGE